MNNPLISVILPCYNAAQFLPAALDSIINQTYSYLEIICIDDGSTDNTLQIIEAFAKKDDRIVLVQNEKNLGLIDTLNKGLQLAKGEYIARMDADDISLPDRIEKQLVKIQELKADVLSNGYYIIDESGLNKSRHLPKCYSKIGCAFASFFITPITHASILARIEVFKNNPYHKTESTLHVEDYDLWCRLIRNNYSLANLPDALYKVRINSKSVSRKFEKLQKSNFVNILQDHYYKSNGSSINLETAKVLGLRIDKSVQIKNLKSGLKTLTSLYKKYKLQAKESEQKEIKNVYSYLLISILLQALKRGNWLVRISALFYFAVRLPLFFNRTAINYYFNR